MDSAFSKVINATAMFSLDQSSIYQARLTFIRTTWLLWLIAISFVSYSLEPICT